jgi:hypothetical protein
MDAKKKRQMDAWNKIQMESQKRYREKSQSKEKSIEKSPIKKQGKTRIKVVSWQNILKGKMRGKKCQNILCQNPLGLDGTNIVCEHMLPQGKYPHLRLNLHNVAFVCGCINLDEYKGRERIERIKRHFPDNYDFVMANL